MSAERITRRSLEDRKKGATDWSRLRALGEQDIERAGAGDRDNPLWSDAELRSARLVLPSAGAKVPLSIRLDREVIDYFKSQGPGYQSRMGAVLLSYVRAHEGPDQAGAERTMKRHAGSKVASAKKERSTTKRPAAKAATQTRKKK